MSRSIVFLAVMVLLAGDRAFAQDRGGFTALVDLGVGIQNDTSIEETEVGLAGISFGVGGFVTPDLAVMFRLAGTNVNYELAGGDYGQISGVAGAAVQWWLSKPVQRRSRRRFRVLARRHRRRQHRLRTALRSRRADFQPW